MGHNNFVFSAWSTSNLAARTAAGFKGGITHKDDTIIIGSKGDTETSIPGLDLDLPKPEGVGELPNWPLMNHQEAITVTNHPDYLPESEWLLQ